MLVSLSEYALSLFWVYCIARLGSALLAARRQTTSDLRLQDFLRGKKKIEEYTEPRTRLLLSLLGSLFGKAGVHDAVERSIREFLCEPAQELAYYLYVNLAMFFLVVNALAVLEIGLPVQGHDARSATFSGPGGMVIALPVAISTPLLIAGFLEYKKSKAICSRRSWFHFSQFLSAEIETFGNVPRDVKDTYRSIVLSFRDLQVGLRSAEASMRSFANRMAELSRAHETLLKWVETKNDYFLSQISSEVQQLREVFASLEDAQKEESGRLREVVGKISALTEELSRALSGVASVLDKGDELMKSLRAASGPLAMVLASASKFEVAADGLNSHTEKIGSVVDALSKVHLDLAYVSAELSRLVEAMESDGHDSGAQWVRVTDSIHLLPEIRDSVQQISALLQGHFQDTEKPGEQRLGPSLSLSKRSGTNALNNG